MNLQAKVIEVKSGSEYSDGHERVTLRIKGEEASGYLTVPNDDGLGIDDSVELDIGSRKLEAISRTA